ncbi:MULTISPECIES: penicillin acylase family protein [Amycolatopsis]|uniref:Penicillin amidase n=2 Tax=Amycolatopsis echigonensis TaxID=2576905 RepID=A0A2N3WNK5_9PSEU|nr:MULTISPECIES: penicillin acylase family protein [Amycolatopsis]PKV95451.1 penicillin amidase [Amycolatopsis niigatensis]
MSKSSVARKVSLACQALVIVLASVAMPGVAGASPGAPGPDPGGYADYCRDQCHDILPPGQGSNLSRSEVLQQFAKTRSFSFEVPHGRDQVAAYDSLRTNYQNLTNEKIGEFMNSSSFAVPQGGTGPVPVPGRDDVTISRDARGVPYIKGTTRDGTTYGSGYAAGQDRLFMMDLLRNMVNGSAVQFAGSVAGDFQKELWPKIAETVEDRDRQIEQLRNSGPDGVKIVRDLQNYVDGINRYIKDASGSSSYLKNLSTAKDLSAGDRAFIDSLKLDLPADYWGKLLEPGTAVVGELSKLLQGNFSSIDLGKLIANAPKLLEVLHAPEIKPFSLNDVVGAATLLGGQFGAAGGGQALAAVAKVAAELKYGKEQGSKVWDSLRSADDPETTVTQRGAAKVPYGASPKDPQHVAMPDPGSLTEEPVEAGSGGSASAGAPTEGTSSSPEALPRNYLGRAKGMSNALVVSGAHTKSGSPIAMFGPQTGYFAPEILMLQDIQGPGISAHGVMFPGTGPYVLIGRGPDYSWSATSAHQSIIDTYTVKLCNVDGRPAGKESDGYLDGGKCEKLDPVESADGLRVLRTKYGIVRQRATVEGVPVAYTELRSTYRNEMQVALGFMRFNDPEQMKGPEDFQKAASEIGFTFNWFYADSKHTAYYNSGLQPVRAANVDPNLPIWANPETEWRNWDPKTNVVQGMPGEQHPASIDQDYYVSWNNKSAEGQVDGSFGDGSVHRADLLDRRVKDLIANGKKIDRADLAKTMEDAAVADLRGEMILPNLLQVLDSGSGGVDPAVKKGLEDLRRWKEHGAKRNTMPGAKIYIDDRAIKIMDAWWPRLVDAMFRPGMGDQLYAATERNLQVDEAPSTPTPGGKTAPHRGSAFEYGWWSYVDKDLRATLGQQVNGPMPTRFCGTLEDCRGTLLRTLKEAVDTPSSEVYPGDDECKAGDAWCADKIRFTPMGAALAPSIGWQNRPTYQQLVEFPKHR